LATPSTRAATTSSSRPDVLIARPSDRRLTADERRQKLPDRGLDGLSIAIRGRPPP
jgi:hypothetical protein